MADLRCGEAPPPPTTVGPRPGAQLLLDQAALPLHESGRDAASQGLSLVIGRAGQPPRAGRRAGAMAAGSRRRDRAAPLRGRSRELSVLGKFLDAVRASGSRVLVVRGEPGVGKTALLDYLQEQASGFHVARAAGVESEMELPFAGLISCARRCWITLNTCLLRSVRRCGPRSASAPDRSRTGSWSAWRCWACCPRWPGKARYCALSMTRSGLTGPRRRPWGSWHGGWRPSRSA